VHDGHDRQNGILNQSHLLAQVEGLYIRANAVKSGAMLTT
jgi:hypothetical protein